MVQFNNISQDTSIIKIVGIGGGGNNAIQHMFEQKIRGVDFIACNTDKQILDKIEVTHKIQLGPKLTQGLGAGTNPEVGRKATEESIEEIKKALSGAKLVFVTTGLGGGTGTGGAPIIAKLCKELNIISISIVTTPFNFESTRNKVAEAGLRELRQYTDTLIVINNEKIREHFGSFSFMNAFKQTDTVLATAIKSITSIINGEGLINRDFADICTVVKDGGIALIGHATLSKGEDLSTIVQKALSSPLLNNNSIEGAKRVLFNLTFSAQTDPTFDEVEQIAQEIKEATGNSEIMLIPGFAQDNQLEGIVSLTIIATGFDHKEKFETPVPVKRALNLEQQTNRTPPAPPSALIRPTRPDKAGYAAPAMPTPYDEASGSFAAHNGATHSPQSFPAPTTERPQQAIRPPYSDLPPQTPDSGSVSNQMTPAEDANKTEIPRFVMHNKIQTEAVPSLLTRTDHTDLREEERKREERNRKKREEISALSMDLPMDFENPNSEAYKNKLVINHPGHHQPSQEAATLSHIRIQKDNDQRIIITKDNKFLNGGVPD